MASFSKQAACRDFKDMWELDEGFGGPYERFARDNLEAAVSWVP